MEKQHYYRTITVNKTPAEAMAKISQVNHWWKHDFSGHAEKIHDKFTVPFSEVNGERAFVDFQVTELEPNQKIVWKVIDCNLPWFTDKKEWNNTQVVFDITSEGKSTKIDFTHIGLVPGLECYDVCEKGWDGHVTKSLSSFINEGKGNPQ